MTLGELIDALKKVPSDRVVPLGFAHPHSYRGFYDELAFEPAKNTTVKAMLDAAEIALGSTFTGWKGGEYTMGEYTDVWIAERGCCGEGIGPMLLSYMLGEAAALRAAEQDEARTCEKVAEDMATDGDEQFGQALMRNRIAKALRVRSQL